MKHAHSSSIQEKKDPQKKKKKKKKKKNKKSTKADGAPEQNIVDTVMSQTCLFQQIVGFLHWKDGIALGEVSKNFRKSYQMDGGKLLQPLLKLLEGLCKSNVHSYCREVYAPASKRVCTCDSTLDPDDDLEMTILTFKILCAEMVHFLTTIVANMRPHLNFTDTANPRNMPATIRTFKSWSLGSRVAGNGILGLYPQRAALAFNILGAGGIDPGGSSFGTGICATVEEMIPLEDKDFVQFLRKDIFPSTETLALLGALSSRVILCAPFLEWVKGDDTIALPEGLENFDGPAAQRAMDQWAQDEEEERRAARET